MDHKAFLLYVISVLILLIHEINRVRCDTSVLNIDCGATSDSFTDYDGNVWVGDDQFIKSGFRGRVQSVDSSSPKHLITLRYFPMGSTHCYNIPNVAVQGRTIKVAAIFNHGRYDGAASAPLIGIQFGKSRWWQANASLYGPVMYSMAYVADSDCVKVCLGDIGYTPFVSAIRIFNLDDTTSYDHSVKPRSSTHSCSDLNSRSSSRRDPQTEEYHAFVLHREGVARLLLPENYVHVLGPVALMASMFAILLWACQEEHSKEGGSEHRDAYCEVQSKKRGRYKLKKPDQLREKLLGGEIIKLATFEWASESPTFDYPGEEISSLWISSY